MGPGLPNTACRLHLNICNVPKCNVLFSVLLYDDFIPGLGIRSSIIRSFRSRKKERRDRFDLFQYRIYLSITKNDRFDRKTDYQILKPALFFSSFALLSL